MLNIDLSLPDGTEELKEKFEILEFKNVSFSYSKDFPVLNNLSFKIKKGEKIAVVGKSGTGKTTLMNLIKRNYFADTGSISINNIDYKNLTRKSVLSLMGVIEQKENLLEDTIENNIGIVAENFSENDIRKSSEKADISETIEKLPEKYKTILGSKGTALSTGQSQRISLARVFLKNPEIILLDEATSGLDNISEAKIMENINEQFKEKTIIAVTHRLSMTKNFDKIFVLGKDGITESGTYEELVNKRGDFYNILQGNEKEI